MFCSAARRFSSTAAPVDFHYTIVGGGVIGLAIAANLLRRPEARSVLVLERHGLVGSETSSRNSEVIHAGLYYGLDSLKTRLCCRGRALLYAYCRDRGIPHRKLGKWIVAQTPEQRQALEGVYRVGRKLDIPLRWVDRGEGRRAEPDVRADAGVLESPETGIVDSASLLQALEGKIDQAGGMISLFSEVVSVQPSRGGNSRESVRGPWQISIADRSSSSPPPSTPSSPSSPSRVLSTITTNVVINAAGLQAVPLYDRLFPTTPPHFQAYYAKGNYFSYSHPPASASSSPPIHVRRLVYPAPEPGNAAAAGLGTHLTLDLSGRMRFGPDVEWVTDPTDLQVHPHRVHEALTAIQAYLPRVEIDGLAPDYAGIRPKLGPAGTKSSDFVIRRDGRDQSVVSLLGMESPGLTSSLAVGEYVANLVNNVD